MRKTLKALFAILAIVLAVGISHTSMAYFADSVTGHQTPLQTTLTIGTWTQVYTWSPTAVYKTGDLVTWNGKTYKALRASTHKEPGKNGSQNFWQAI